MDNLLRQIPKVDDILKHEAWKVFIGSAPETLAKESLRASLDRLRHAIKEGTVSTVPAIPDLVTEVRERVTAILKPGLKKVINGTGVIIHTNLGRSLLADSAVKAITDAATHYTNLEYDLEQGTRGDRYEHCAAIITRLTGAEAALVVNNNAGAVFLVLNTLSEGKEALIARGELVEIGGSFRIPDVMEKSGALLREVGTTNRTYKEDYGKAISPVTGLIMKVHTSNYRIRGFVHETATEDLVDLGRSHDIPTFYDAGSGLVFPLEETGVHDEPPIGEAIARGIDLISFSGDKLLGAPQAGIIAGRKEYIDRIKKNPLTRALRPDKFTLAGLESTLLLYLDETRVVNEIPTLRMMYEDREIVLKRAKRVAARLRRALPDTAVAVVDLFSEVGGGSLPDVMIPSAGIAIQSESMSIRNIDVRLRALDIPIVGRIEKDNLIIDMRTVLRDDESPMIAGLIQALAGEGR